MTKGMPPEQSGMIQKHCEEWVLFETNDKGDEWQVDRLLKPYNLLQKKPPPKFMFKLPGSEFKLEDLTDITKNIVGPQYAVELWSGLNTVFTRHDCGMDTLRDFTKMLSSVSKSSIRYGQGVRASVQKNTMPTNLSGTSRTFLAQLWKETESLATLWNQFGEDLRNFVIEPLETLRKEQIAARGDLERTASELVRDAKAKQSAFEKKKGAYIKACETADYAYHNLSNAQLDPSFNTKSIAKLAATFSKLEEEADAADDLYKKQLQEYRAFQPSFEKEMKKLLLGFQHLEEVRMAKFKQRANKYAQLRSTFTANKNGILELTLSSVQQSDMQKDINDWMESNTTGRGPDPEYQYEPPGSSGVNHFGSTDDPNVDPNAAASSSAGMSSDDKKKNRMSLFGRPSIKVGGAPSPRNPPSTSPAVRQPPPVAQPPQVRQPPIVGGGPQRPQRPGSANLATGIANLRGRGGGGGMRGRGGPMRGRGGPMRGRGGGMPRASPPPVKPPPITPIASKTMATSLYPYTAKEANELTFPVGALITVTDDSDPGWWKGTYNGSAEALFPANYVKKCVEKKALYEYQAKGNDELSISVGDSVIVLKEHEGWVTARNTSGGEGLVPSNYLS
eukprot:CAMPEP_0201560518 /NCGR_PEP_ID=MMETSP0173_2-20130828/78312_1 /ASSEMBLY_ACC=CAM_ASM_000268 /TAXON_ID=218659 /ORGANISM="Vexillifera sp., Strain DIVA3 564/2" /LENGTH=617 /DNA_ID=CAMNT_0047974971 /DNA_START=177 /DNA_END=2030 /DNA_ORIENTATION=-